MTKAIRPTFTCNAVIATLASGVVAFAASAFGADAPKMQPLTLSKECSQYSGGAPSFYTVIESSVPALKKGTKVLYYGPVTSNPAFSSNDVVLDDGAGNTAMGNCIVDFGSGPKGLSARFTRAAGLSPASPRSSK